MKIKRVLRLTVAVRDAAAAAATFEDLLGAGPLGGPGEIDAFGARAAEVALGDSRLQLVSPVDADSALMRFLERKGEGFYNLALEVDDLDEAVRELAARGVRVSEPVEAERGVRSAFVTMAVTHGLSVQLVQVSAAAPPPPAPAREPAAEPAPPAEPAAWPQRPVHAAVPPAAEWADREEPAERQPLDFTPDEWSDID